MKKFTLTFSLALVIISNSNLAFSQTKLQEMTLLVGSAIGAISSSSCGGQRQVGNNAKSVWINLLDKELSLGKISEPQRKSLETLLTKMITQDMAIRHPAKTCKSAKKLMSRLTN